MSVSPPACRSIEIIAFRGDRSRAFAARFLRELEDEKTGRAPGPSALECLFFTGHVGVSTDGGIETYGFNPDPGIVPTWQAMEQLKDGKAFRGVVREDTAVFSTARSRGLFVQSFEIILPEPAFHAFATRLDAERNNSQYSYGFPNGDGDCNCVTWLERLGLPLFTGRMDEFATHSRFGAFQSRRFGECI
jgi:hypothetical protein